MKTVIPQIRFTINTINFFSKRFFFRSVKNTQIRLRQPDNEKWTLLTKHLYKNMKILTHNVSREPAFYDTNYMTLGKFWSVRRTHIVYMQVYRFLVRQTCVSVGETGPSCYNFHVLKHTMQMKRATHIITRCLKTFAKYCSSLKAFYYIHEW